MTMIRILFFSLVFGFIFSQTTVAQTKLAQENFDNNLAPLVDFENGGHAVNYPNTKTITNPDGTSTTIDGALEDGTLLPEEGEGFIRDSHASTSWGAGVMISLLENSSSLYMQTYQPKVKIYVGDIAMEHGGPYRPHSSHQSGLDADVLYMGNTRYESVLDKDGFPNEKFHAWDNWNYWRILVSQKMMVKGKLTSVVSMILVDPKLKEYLTTWVAEQGIAENELDAEILTKLRPTVSHDDHFHLRLRCSPFYLKCL